MVSAVSTCPVVGHTMPTVPHIPSIRMHGLREELHRHTADEVFDNRVHRADLIEATGDHESAQELQREAEWIAEVYLREEEARRNLVGAHVNMFA